MKDNALTVINKKAKEDLKKKISAKLMSRGADVTQSISADQLYQAAVLVLKDIMIDKRQLFRKETKKAKTKKICYMCMEFLVGRSLKTTAYSLGIYNELDSVFKEYGFDIDYIYSFESDPGLGNGGLGRLAACFMDSLSSLNYLANGYSLLYENGLFKQRY